MTEKYEKLRLRWMPPSPPSPLFNKKQIRNSGREICGYCMVCVCEGKSRGQQGKVFVLVGPMLTSWNWLGQGKPVRGIFRTWPR